MWTSVAAKRYGRAAAGIVPRSLAIAGLRAAAVAPPCIKTVLFHRLCAAFARQHVESAKLLVRTNLGISAGLKCYVPLGKYAHVFGRPEHNLSERSTLALAALLSRECAHFVDVGANEGVFTLVISRNRRSGSAVKIHWFEPDDELCARIERNLAFNGVEAQGNNVAVSASSGVATFYKNLTDDLSGSLGAFFTHKHDTREQSVKTAALSDYFGQHRIDEALVKVDVEGHAAEVWKGACAIAEKIKYLIIEIIEPDAQLPARIITDTGWHAYYMRDFDLVHSRDGRFDYVEPFWNWLFCRLAPADLAQKLAGTKFHVRWSD